MAKQLEAWRSDLIDFSRRNTLLNQSSRSTQIPFISPRAEEIFLNLLDAKSWKIYRPKLTDEDQVSEEILDDDLIDSLENKKNIEPIVLRPDEVESENRNREKLEANLRTLRRRAEQEFLDKGLRILYLAFGAIEWLEREEKWLSPLVLVPIQIEKNADGQFFFVMNDEEDVVVNPALIEKLKDSLGISVEIKFDEDRPLSVIEEFKKLCSEQKGWSVKDSVRIGIYSFQKEVMYRDLLQNAEAIAESDLVEALAFGSKAKKDFSFDYSLDNDFDEKYPPASLLSILDADSTQRKAIVAAKEGKSFVIDGPPGTGKSQTIANIISELIGSGKSVLFVSEKAAALEVVQKRLTAAGLGSFLLPLHSQNVSRKSFASSLMKAANERSTAGKKLPATDLEKLSKTQKNLSAYVGSLNSIREPLGKSLFSVIGEHALLNEFPLTPSPSSSINKTLEPSRFNEIIASTQRLSRVWGSIDNPEVIVWRGLSDPKIAREKTAQIAISIEKIKRAIDLTRTEGENIADSAGIPVPESLEDIRGLVTLAQLFASIPSVPAAWLSTDDIELFTDQFENACSIIGGLQSSLELLNDRLPSWETLPLDIGDQFLQVKNQLSELKQEIPEGSITTKEFSKLVTRVDNACSGLAMAEEYAQQLERRFGNGPSTITLHRAKTLSSAAKLAAAAHRPESLWFSATGIEKALGMVKAFTPSFNEYWEKQKQIDPYFKDEIRKFDISSIWDAEKGEPILGIFSADGRKNRKELSQFSKNGKLTTGGRSVVKTLVEMQELAKKIQPTKSTISTLGEGYFQGVETDWESLTDALKTAREVLKIIGEKDSKKLADALGRAALDVEETAELGESITSAIDEFSSAIKALRNGKVSNDGRILGILETEKKALDLYKKCSSLLNLDVPEGTERSIIESIEIAENRTLYAKSFAEFQKFDETFASLIGEMYAGNATDISELRRVFKWAADVRNALPRVASQRLAERIIAQGVESSPDLEIAVKDLDDTLLELSPYFTDERMKEISNEIELSFDISIGLLDSLENNFDQINDAITFEEEIEHLSSFGLAESIEFLKIHKINSNMLEGAITKTIYSAWIDSVIDADRTRLGPLDKKSRDSEVETFAEIDGKLKSHASALVTQAASGARPTLALGKMGVLRRQAELKTRHMRIPDLLTEVKEIVHDIVPCFMMSPLSVSTFLPPDLTFDVVIFDEASQIMTSNAINCVYRGRQLIIAGDDKQMPPSNLFATASASDDSDEYSEEDVDDFESLLNQANAGGLQNIKLLWHYRSRHESLITYSNQSFYEGKLVTYPSPDNFSDSLGVSFIHVPDGVYLRGGRRSNPIEAKKVVERIIHHADTNPGLTLGVVAFSVAQADEIENALEVALKARPDLVDFFKSDRLDGFFIKNLESVQGDERDIIIFSVGYGRDEHGKLTMNFGPVNRPKGWRRLNVAFTRARCRVELVSSITASDFASGTNESINHLHRYFDYADRGIAALAFETDRSAGDAESPFEESVIQYIRSIGYDVDPQVGQAGYRIDMAVTDPDHPGSYVLGIECDGAAYHSSEIARDRDRLRQEVLEGLGWTLYRIWGPTWYRSRATAETDLKTAIDKAMNGRSKIPSLIQNKNSKTPIQTDVTYETIEIELSDIPSWVEPYYLLSSKELPKLEERNGVLLHSSVETFLTALIKLEGPVDRTLLQKRFANRINQSRTKKIQDYVDERLRMLLAKGIVKVWQPDAFTLIDQNPFRVRHQLSDDPLTRRDAKTYPLPELAAAIYNIVEEVGEIDREELLSVVGKKLLGLQRLTTEWGDHIDSAVDKVASWGWIASTGKSISRADDYPKGSEKPWFRNH